jgi:hypothetical protein
MRYSFMLPKTEEHITAKWFIYLIWKSLKKNHPKLIAVESNLIHFIIHDLQAKHPEIKLTHGWFVWGPYYPAIDDVLVEEGFMDVKYHQMNPNGENTMMEKLIRCGCHDGTTKKND